MKKRYHLFKNFIKAKQLSLNGSYKEAADLTGDGQINSADLLKLRQYLLGQTNINQL